MESLAHWREAFNSVGWFLPPYTQMGYLEQMVGRIRSSNGMYSQERLEQDLLGIYGPGGLAAMVVDRYPALPKMGLYAGIISEAIEAHFLGLHHVAVAGLLPVIEGGLHEMARGHGVSTRGHTHEIMIRLVEKSRARAINQSIGAVGEVISMLDSFCEFCKKCLYSGSDFYPFPDMTNRHGILHGRYASDDYGRPINFYKVIACVNFLCWLESFDESLSWFAPNQTKTSQKLANYYINLLMTRKIRPKISVSPK